MAILSRDWISLTECIFFSIGSTLECGIQGIADILSGQGVKITSIDPSVASIISMADVSPVNEKSAK